MKGIKDFGVWGIIAGGASGAGGGIAAAIVFGFLTALIFKPKTKK